MKHLIVERTPAHNAWTACDRVVAGASNYTADPDKVDCGECLKKTHKNRSFEATRITRKVTNQQLEDAFLKEIING